MITTKANGHHYKIPQDLYIPPDALEISLEQFQGPLDLLLYLIRKQNLSIVDIPVALITEQYMEYVSVMQDIYLDLAGDYLLMAATLTELKSRMLLPKHNLEDEGEDDPRALLTQQLQEYLIFKNASEDLNALSRLERDNFLLQVHFDFEPKVAEIRSGDAEDLARIFREVLARRKHEKNWAVTENLFSVSEKMQYILERIEINGNVMFSELLESSEGKMGLVVSFFSILELTKDKSIHLMQNTTFSPIYLSKKII